MFSHEKLKVYQKGLTCAARLAQLSRSWDKRHAVVDHLLRASESIVLNLVEGTCLRNAAQRQHFAEYAMGSGLECAAGLDIAAIKAWIAPELATAEKRAFSEVVKMLTGWCSTLPKATGGILKETKANSWTSPGPQPQRRRPTWTCVVEPVNWRATSETTGSNC